MHYLSPLVLAVSIFLCSTIQAMDSEPSAKDSLVNYRDVIYLIFTFLDFPDQVAFSMTAKNMRQIGEKNIFAYLKPLTITHENAPEIIPTMLKRLYKVKKAAQEDTGIIKVLGHLDITDDSMPKFMGLLRGAVNQELPVWHFSAPVIILVTTSKELEDIGNLLCSSAEMPNSAAYTHLKTTNLSLMCQGDSSKDQCKAGAHLAKILHSQPLLKKLTFKAQPMHHDSLPKENAQLMGKLQNLEYCHVENLEIRSASMKELAMNASLKALWANRFRCDGATDLPKNLSILTIDGCSIDGKFFSCLRSLNKLEKLSVRSGFSDTDEAIDISPDLIVVFSNNDNLKEVDINGLYTIDGAVYANLVKKAAPRIWVDRWKARTGKSGICMAMSDHLGNYSPLQLGITKEDKHIIPAIVSILREQGKTLNFIAIYDHQLVAHVWPGSSQISYHLSINAKTIDSDLFYILDQFKDMAISLHLPKQLADKESELKTKYSNIDCCFHD